MKRYLQGLALIAASALLAVISAEALLHLFPVLLPIELKLAVRERGIAHSEVGGLPEPNSTGSHNAHRSRSARARSTGRKLAMGGINMARANP